MQVTIDANATCPGWREVCPAAEDIAREVAERALICGMKASKLVWRAPLEVGIVLTDAAEQQRLNRDYRGQDRPTNVLAFPAWQPGTAIPPGAPLLLGDVVLALEVVVREATQYRKPVTDHLTHLVVHGMLHLLGFDHLTETGAAEMESLERSILAERGLPDPYHDTMSFIKA
ncbi:MAG: rRNA maturation RNase YbeY [Stellaceae bacterium]